MASYSVSITASAEKELKKLFRSIVERVFPHLEELAFNPRPARYKKLKGGDNEWRIRVGSQRSL